MTLMKWPSLVSFSLVLLSALMVGGFALAGFFYQQKETIAQEKAAEIESSRDRENQFQQRINDLEARYQNTLDQLALSLEERQELQEDLEQEQERVDEIEDEYDRINDTVRDLVKLSNTDEELLQKYSRVYFLNENYIPQNLSTINQEYIHGSKSLQIHSKVWPFLEELMEEAKEEGLDLQIISAYRSFDYQGELKQRYLAIYGSGANQFSADQGYSEHQLGSTVDFTTGSNGSSLSSFDQTEEFAWLQKKAHRYGFTLSYPDGNSFYQYEPWHWRFVGTDLADDLRDDEKHFYDLDQRDIDDYLLEIFD